MRVNHLPVARRAVRTGAILLILFHCGACASRGPGRMPPDRFDYNQAVAQSSSEQMLLNIVRLRYSDVPEFLGVTSVLTQYVFSVRGNLAASVGTANGEDADSAGLGASTAFIERPTITFAPLTGEDFVRQLLTPIPSEALFSLLQSGWPVDLLLLLGLERVNDVVNIPFRPAAPDSTEGHEKFAQGVEILIGLALRGAIELQVELERAAGELEPREQRYLVFADLPDPEVQALLEQARELFVLAPGVWRFRVTSQRIGRTPDEITLRNRSLVALMGFLSHGVEIPQAHLEERLVGLEQPMVDCPLRVQSSVERPEGAAVAVPYKDHWFYIEASDTRALEAFGLLRYLFLLMSPSIEGAGPLVTIPAG